jgi:hypothetical protein
VSRLLDHPALHSMVQNMQPDQATKKFLVLVVTSSGNPTVSA